jgi:ribulose-phosphate 3-epimerase
MTEAQARPTMTGKRSAPLVLPSILSADFARLGDEVESAIEAGADGIHIDVMDGHFVPNLTMGPAVVASLRQRFPQLLMDVHLMVSEPEVFIEPFAKAGADHLTFHIEPFDQPTGPRPVINLVRAAGCTVGMAINPPTPALDLEAVVDELDLVLVMSVHPGFAGQRFMPEVLDKARDLRSKMRDGQRLEMDGGINAETVAAARDAGCDALVAASAFFSAEDRRAMAHKLRGE